MYLFFRKKMYEEILNQFLTWFYIITVIIIIILMIVKRNKRNTSNYLYLSERFFPFKRKKYFFSYPEIIFFKNLKKTLNENFSWSYGIFPKVRLADIFDADNQGNLNRIRSKHIDYLIIDYTNNCNPVFAIELNWKSHYSFKVRESDNFKKELFKNTWLPLLYFYNNEIENINFIENKIKTLLIENSPQPQNLEKNDLTRERSI